MRKILAVSVVTLVALVVGSSSAQVPSLEDHAPAIDLSPGPTMRTAAVKVLPPPLRLPNTKALTTRLLQSSRKTAAHQLTASRQVVAFFEKPDLRWMRALRHEKCWEVPWQRTCTIARASYRLHLTLALAAQRKLEREFPLTNDWVTAVRIAQRVYPGTSERLLGISDHEGGRGQWVWYAGSCGNPPCLWHGYHIGKDVVGGWEQFRYTTFAPYYRGMVKDLVRRGYTIPDWPDRGGPEMYRPWLDPLGQALTAGYMHYYGKQGHHWPF